MNRRGNQYNILTFIEKLDVTTLVLTLEYVNTEELLSLMKSRECVMTLLQNAKNSISVLEIFPDQCDHSIRSTNGRSLQYQPSPDLNQPPLLADEH